MPCLIAVPITSASPALDDQVREALAGGAELIELRVDAIGDVAAVETLLSKRPEGRFIVTIRCAPEGGQWDGDDAERIALYERLGLLLPGYIDVELATWQRSANLRQKLGLVCDTSSAEAGTQPREVNSASMSTARRKNRLILSHHNWRDTPADIEAVCDALMQTPAAVIKAVFKAQDARDAIRIIAALRRFAPHRPTIALGLGEAGLLTRVLARKFNAFLTFAALRPESASAPGQPALSDLSNLYHWGALGPATRVFGVVGWPVRHSRSPAIHNAALAANDIDGVYLPLPVAPDCAAFADFMNILTRATWLDLAGLSVTIPHKEHAFRWLSENGARLSPLTRRCGAVNTITRIGAESLGSDWHGDNTDATGTLTALDAAGAFVDVAVSARQADALLTADVLGAGGVARAVVVALLDRGCRVTLYNRTNARAAALAAELGCGHAPWERRLNRTGRIIVNCTSVGLAPDIDRSPLPPEALRGAALVFDTIYTPADTRLLSDARSAGSATVTGVELFLHQARAQYQRWHNRLPPIELWRTILRAAP